MTTDKTVDPTEVDTCRICSGPAEEDQPLFYPCKCSGTIRYIHQDCLTTWLAHSKKRSCDVCKYEYGFTKVYKNDMPRRLPPRLFLRKLSLQMVKVVITSLRLVMISVIWLAILPYLTLWVWRFYFWTGEALAYWVVGKEIPNRTYSPPKPTSEPLTEDTPSTPPPPQSPWFNVNILPQELGADIFKGQIITIAVVIVFLTIFLLREWIIQNARPGVFGDEEPAEPVAAVPDAPPVEVAQDPAAGAALVAAQLLNALEPVAAFEEPQIELLPEAEDDVEVVEPELREDFLDEHEHDALTDDPIDEDGEDSASAHSEDDVVSIPSNSEGEHGQAEAPTLQAQSLDTPTEQTLVPQEAENASFDDTSAIPSSSKLDQSSSTVFGASTKLGNDLSLPSSFAFSSPATTSGSLGASIESSLDGSRPADSQMYSSLSSDATQPQFQTSVADFSFTFSAPHRPSVQEEALNVPLPDSPIENRPTIFGALGSDSAPMPSGPMAIQAPRPHQIRPSRAGPSKRMTSSTPAFNKNAKDFDEFRFSFSSTPTTLSQGSSRHSSRPPLPPSTPGVDEPTPLVDSGMASPHVALYRPPEDLSSAAPEYFDRFPIASSSKTALPHSSSTETEKPAGDDDENLQNPESSSDEEEPYIPQPPRQRHVDDRVFMREFEQRGEVRRRGLAQAPPIAPLPAPPPPPLDDDEDDVDEDPQDIEPMGDDDMDGALEAIGMRGPITSVFQNVFLMIFIIDLAIAVGIWMPFTMGKTTALLFLQPADVLALVRFPIIAVRVMTDPIVDTLLLLLNFLIRPIKWGIGHILPSTVLVSKQAAAAPPAPKAGLSLAVIQNAVFRHWDRLLEHSHAAANASAPRPSPTNAIERLVFRLPAPSVQSLEHVESRFAAFGRAVRLFSHAFARRWQQLALADGTSERAFAICLGYAVLCMVMGIYLGVLNAGAVRGAARALRNAVKQQLIVVKVALFIGLELLVFPTGCGVVLDIATLPLFEPATLAGRVAFYDFAPLTAFFCHWLVGTIFMYQFALTLGACRAVMRPGAMWFIKDPQDASFSPIRDILDKRVLTQLRKLAVSAVMYTVVIVVAVGSVVYTIRYAAMFSGILPLRGNMREPLSEIPVDLLFLHLVMPPTVKRLTIGSWVKVRLEVWWKYTARQLRLSSFMFNKLYADELQRESRGLRPIEGPTEGWTIPQDDQLYGRWLRVPKSDNIAFLRDQPVLIEVNQAGQAVRQRGREVMAEQDEETRRAGRQPEQDYIIVHVPPYFGMRCMALIILLWLTAAAVTVVGTAGPVVLGRWMLKIFAHKTNVHDGYSLVLGWYVLWGAWRVHQSEVRSWTTAVAWLANVIWIGLGMGVVMPILVAITLQLYVVLPLRLAWDPTMVPVIRVVEEWALGLVLMKIGWQTWRLRNRGRAGAGADAAAAPVPADGAAPEADEVDEADRRVEDLGRAMEQIVRAGLANPDAITATQSFIAPVCGGLLLVIGGPALAVWALGRGGEDVLLTVVYPGIFSLTAAVGVWRAGTKVGKKWLQDVRDAEFLVEMRLKNLEPVR